MKRTKNKIVISLAIAGIAVVPAIAQLASDKKEDATTKLVKPLISKPISMKEVGVFRDASTLHLNEIIRAGGIDPVAGASESCVVDTKAAIGAVDTKVACTKSTSKLADLKPLTLQDATILKTILESKLADKATGDLVVTAEGLSGKFEVQSLDEKASALELKKAVQLELLNTKKLESGLEINRLTLEQK